jgi:very-short-patch-repair endonuclease
VAVAACVVVTRVAVVRKRPQVVEVDGGHHFTFDALYGFDQRAVNNSLHHDVSKEKYAVEQGISMLRIEVDSVRRDLWQPIAESLIKDAIDEDASQIVRHSRGNHYSTGIYADIRKGTSIEV